jgi:PhnB protein
MTQRPERYRNAVVPHIYIDGADAAIAFYKRAFDAIELSRLASPNGKIVHAELEIAGSLVMLGDPDHRLYAEPKSLGACTASLHLMTDDDHELVRRAVEAGCELITPPTTMAYGARSSSVRDPFGHVWVVLAWLETGKR